MTYTALVTGASSGIGREFARKFAAEGHDVVMVARRADALEETARALRSTHGRTITCIALDLAGPDSGTRLLSAMQERGLTADTIINCAGIAHTGDFVDAEKSEIDAQLAVNVDAVVDVCRVFLPGLQASGAGTIVNVASLTAYMPTPGMAVYAATKAFVLRFSEALAYELRESPVRVMAFSPGPTKTDFYRASGSSESGARFQTPEQVVTAAFRLMGARNAPVSSVSGTGNRVVSRLIGLLPKWTALRLAHVPSITSDDA